MALRSIYKSYGVSVLQFSQIHLRITGNQSVDYWPSTGRAWLVGSAVAAQLMSPEQVCELASGELENYSKGDIANRNLDLEFNAIMQ